MYVVQQPVRVQRTSFHYRWEALKREASGNLTPSFYLTVVCDVFEVKTSGEGGCCQHGWHHGRQRQFKLLYHLTDWTMQSGWILESMGGCWLIPFLLYLDMHICSQR